MDRLAILEEFREGRAIVRAISVESQRDFLDTCYLNGLSHRGYRPYGFEYWTEFIINRRCGGPDSGMRSLWFVDSFGDYDVTSARYPTYIWDDASNSIFNYE